MNTYRVYFRTDSQVATHEFKAASPAHALTLARQHYIDDPWDLDFEPHDDGQPVNEIEVCDMDGEELITWTGDDGRSRSSSSTTS